MCKNIFLLEFFKQKKNNLSIYMKSMKEKYKLNMLNGPGVKNYILVIEVHITYLNKFSWGI